MRKKVKPIAIDRYSIKFMISSPPNCQGQQNQGKSENLLQPRGA